LSAQTSVETIWHIPDDLWSLIAPILGPEKPPGTRGRPATPFRVVFEAVVYLAKTGCQWQALPRQAYAPPSTIHGIFSQWVKAGLFKRAWQVLLNYYDEQLGIKWKWQALDGAITKSPLGGAATGPSPVDRGKQGTKRSLLCDQRGAPLSVVVTGANTNDKTVALETLDGIIVERPEKLVYRIHHLCLDKGYDFADVIAGVLTRDYILHLKRRGQDGRDSEVMLLIGLMNVKLRHVIMPLIGFRKTDRLALIPLHTRADVQVVALNRLRPGFADPMALGWQQLLIGFPFIRAVA